MKLLRNATLAIALAASMLTGAVRAAEVSMGDGNITFATPDSWLAIMQTQGEPEAQVFQVPDPSPTAGWSVMVNVLGGPEGASIPDRYPAAFAAQPAVKFHAYGKDSRPGRKVGHVTATGSDLDDVLARARSAAAFFHS